VTVDHFSRALCFAFGVTTISLQSVLPEGDWLRSGKMIVSHGFFRVPERDRERHGLWPGTLCYFGAISCGGRGVDTAESSNLAQRRLRVFSLGGDMRLSGHGCSGCY
jgi:hypothetical protein